MVKKFFAPSDGTWNRLIFHVNSKSWSRFIKKVEKTSINHKKLDEQQQPKINQNGRLISDARI